MKIFIFVIFLFLVLSFTSFAQARYDVNKDENSGKQVIQQEDDNSDQEIMRIQENKQLLSGEDEDETGIKGRNQNEEQNMGEDDQVENREREQEGTQDGLVTEENQKQRSQIARQKMSNVAQKVEELLSSNLPQEGIGEEVRMIAQEQGSAQLKLVDQLIKIESRGKFAKILFGPDYKALKEMERELEQNRMRIRVLERLQNQFINQSDVDLVGGLVESMQEQNESMQNQIENENRVKSALGWFFRLFAK